MNHGSLVKLHFLGTRGNIEARTAEHGKHSVLAVGYRGRQVVIDCGRDWLNEAPEWDADAIVITHAHPDYVDGLKRGVPCPVYATADTWKTIGSFPVRERLTLRQRRKHRIAGMTFEAFAVEHSVRAPAVGYRITAGNTVIFYCPDLVSIHDRRAALRGITAYIGDGATISRSFVRRRGNRLIGHAPIDFTARMVQTVVRAPSNHHALRHTDRDGCQTCPPRADRRFERQAWLARGGGPGWDGTDPPLPAPRRNQPAIASARPRIRPGTKTEANPKFAFAAPKPWAPSATTGTEVVAKIPTSIRTHNSNRILRGRACRSAGKKIACSSACDSGIRSSADPELDGTASHSAAHRWSGEASSMALSLHSRSLRTKRIPLILRTI